MVGVSECACAWVLCVPVCVRGSQLPVHLALQVCVRAGGRVVHRRVQRSIDPRLRSRNPALARVWRREPPLQKFFSQQYTSSIWILVPGEYRFSILLAESWIEVETESQVRAHPLKCTLVFSAVDRKGGA